MIILDASHINNVWHGSEGNDDTDLLRLVAVMILFYTFSVHAFFYGLIQVSL
ncbi:hypothetical protein Lalb_Chr09g0328451 [Lupinus albus]|uniref:Uncharacterized protein n=1 Tax=Lupinus albus TaxID=3870 RepID=A0A6A4Q0E6_LUPAL|nr:hypothetical protein Lalb_Chr09g0328451 [Lupinus albus]